jgi:hypothetical protein
MFNTPTSSLSQVSHRRSADITPASRVIDNFRNSPTSPKIHELRERYFSKQFKKRIEIMTG